MLQYSEIVNFDEALYQKNIEENTFVEPDELDGKGEDNVTDNQG